MCLPTPARNSPAAHLLALAPFVQFVQFDQHLPEIMECFSGGSVNEILERLAESPTEWAAKQRETVCLCTAVLIVTVVAGGEVVDVVEPELGDVT
jgi:hypothetical protein